MKKQNRRVTARVQVQVAPSQKKLSVVKGGTTFNGQAPDTRMLQTAAAFEKLTGGITKAVGGYYARKAKDDFALGQQMAQTGEEAPDPDDDDVSSGYMTTSALHAGLEHMTKLQDVANSIQADNPDSWGGYASPSDAVDAIIKQQTGEAIQGMPPKYAAVFMRPFEQGRANILGRKHKEFVQFRKDDISNKIGAIAAHELDVYSKGDLKSPEGLRKVYDSMLRMLTKDGILSRAEGSAVLAEKVAQFAIELKDPEMISDLLEAKDKHGVSLASTAIGDPLRRSLKEASRLANAEFNTGKITLMDSVNKLVEEGSYGIDEAEQINQEMPGLYSNEQQAALLKRARLNRERVAEISVKKVLNTSLYHADKLYQIADGAEKNKIVEAGHNEIRELGELNDLPEKEIIKRQVQHLSGNGIISKEFDSIINNGAIIQGDGVNAEVPEAFRKAFDLFSSISAVNKSVALRHLTNSDAKANILRFQAIRDSGATEQEAYALVQQTAQDPILAGKTYASSGKQAELQTAIEDLDINNANSFFGFFDADVGELSNFNQLKRYAVDQAETLVKLGLRTDVALDYMKSAVEGNYRVYNNRAVFTGGQQLPEDWDDFGDTVLKSIDLDSDDYFIEPARDKAGLVYVYQNNGIWTGKSFKLATTYKRYEDRNKKTLTDAKKSLSANRAKQNKKEINYHSGFATN